MNLTHPAAPHQQDRWFANTERPGLILRWRQITNPWLMCRRFGSEGMPSEPVLIGLPCLRCSRNPNPAQFHARFQGLGY